MAGRNPEPLDEVEDMELKGLRLDLIDLVSDYTNADTGYIPYMSMYEEELEALVGLPKERQRKELEAVAYKVIASYQKDYYGGAGKCQIRKNS